MYIYNIYIITYIYIYNNLIFFDKKNPQKLIAQSLESKTQKNKKNNKIKQTSKQTNKQKKDKMEIKF